MAKYTKYAAELQASDGLVYGLKDVDGRAELGAEISDLKSALDDMERFTAVYGASGFNNAEPTLTRLYAAVGMTAQAGTDGDNSSVVNDFDKVPLFARRKCVGYWTEGDGKAVFHVNAYDGDPDYTEDGSNGDYVAVDCLPAYVREEDDGNIRLVSSVPMPGFRPFAILADGENSSVCRAHTYLPAYGLVVDKDGHGTSLPGYAQRHGTYAALLTDCRSYADSGAAKYAMLEPDEIYYYEETLYDIEFATHNCQSVMAGCSVLRSDNNDMCKIFGENQWLLANFNAARVPGEYVSIQPATVDRNSTAYYASHKIVSLTRCDATGAADASGAYTLVETEDLGSGRTYEEGTDYRFAARPYYSGACGNVGTPSGSPVSNSSGYYPMRYRYRENVFANQHHTTMDLFNRRVASGENFILEWYRMRNPAAWGNTNPSEANLLDTSLFDKLSYVTPAENCRNGWITEEKYDERFPDNKIPIVGTGGSAAKYVCDFAYLVSSYSVRSVRRGGYLYDGGYTGFGYRSANHAPSIGYAFYGGGLFFQQ